MSIYNDFINLLPPLSPERCQAIKEQRGLAPETLKKFNIKPAIPQISIRNASGYGAIQQKSLEREIIKKLTEKYTVEELLASGVVKYEQRELKIATELKGDREIIPYYDEMGNVIFLRQHKYSLEGKGVEIFRALRDSRTVIMTEGEYKAMALWQLGYSAIAIPGISSFGGKHFPKLYNFLKSQGIEQLYIMFDYDIQDDPNIKKRYKPNPSQRYWTDFWAYWMAHLIEKEQIIECKICFFPREWCIDGKIDPDGALASRKTREDFDTLLKNAYTTDEVRQIWKKEGKKGIILEMRVREKELQSNIQEEENKYIWVTEDAKIVISNFIIEVKNLFVSINEIGEEEVTREVVLVNTLGERSKPFLINPEELASNTNFKQLCLSKGNFHWKGTQRQLDELVDYLMIRSTNKVYNYFAEGYIPEENMYLFDGMAIKNGEIYCGEEVIWIDNEGYRSEALSIDGGKSLRITPHIEEDFDWREAVEKIIDNYNNITIKLGIGWVLATLFSDVFFNIAKCFPILYIAGKTNSGKTTLARHLLAFVGMQESGKNLKDITQVAMLRELAYYSNLPYWVDEYRHTRDLEEKIAVLRNVYNRQVSSKGLAHSRKVRTVAVKGCPMITSEVIPEDNAILRRLVFIGIKLTEQNRNWYHWIEKNLRKFSIAMVELTKKRDKIVEEIKEKYPENIKDLREMVGDDRHAINYAVPMTMLEILNLATGKEFERMIELSNDYKRSIEEETLEQEFFEIVYGLIQHGRAEKEKTFIYRKETISNPEEFWFNFPYIYTEYAKELRLLGKEIMGRRAILNALREANMLTGDRNPMRGYKLNYNAVPDFIQAVLDEIKGEI